MKPTHVLVSGAPGLAREIVVQIVASQQDMTLVATIEEISRDVLSERDDVDVVVLLLDQGAMSHGAALSRIFPTCAVVILGSRGAGAWTYEPEVRRAAEVVGDLTPETVANAIRSAAQLRALRTVIAP